MWEDNISNIDNIKTFFTELGKKLKFLKGVYWSWNYRGCCLYCSL